MERAGGVAQGLDVSAGWRRFAVAIGVFLIVWLPIQTPLLAALYQHAGVSATVARMMLLAKDGIVAFAIIALAIGCRRSIRIRWFDVVAAVYVVTVLVYAVIPLVTGTGLPISAIAASVRAFVLPVELYLLGRLIATTGARAEPLVVLFVSVSAIAAILTLLQYALTSPLFWMETIDLVSFVRDVQGLPNAVDLWSIAALGHFGVGEIATFPRALGPFAHPVGTAHYFLVPLILSVALGVSPRESRPAWARPRWVIVGLVVLFALAVLTPISRGAWIAAAVGLVVVGLLQQRIGRVLVGLALATIFVVLVPPFSYSVQSLIGFTDSSVLGHLIAIQHGISVITDNPLGLGAGHGDHLGEVLAGPVGPTNESAGVGESMYLATLATAGPVGLIALMVWILGVIGHLMPAPPARATWFQVGLVGTALGLLVSSTFASPMMRFTTGASFWLLVGLVALVDGPAGTIRQVSHLIDGARMWLSSRTTGRGRFRGEKEAGQA